MQKCNYKKAQLTVEFSITDPENPSKDLLENERYTIASGSDIYESRLKFKDDEIKAKDEMIEEVKVKINEMKQNY